MKKMQCGLHGQTLLLLQSTKAFRRLSHSLEKIQAFQVTQPTPILQPPLIALIDQGKPNQTYDDFPLLFLIILIKQVIVTPATQQLINLATPGALIKDKCKGNEI